MINVHVIRPQQDWVHVLTFLFCCCFFFSHMPPTSVKTLQNWKLQSPQTRFIKRVCPSERSRSCFPSLRRLSPLSSWRIIKQMVVISKKWRSFFFFNCSVFCLSARQSLFNTMELMSDNSAVPHVRRGHMVLLLPVVLCGETRGQQRRTWWLRHAWC